MPSRNPLLRQGYVVGTIRLFGDIQNRFVVFYFRGWHCRSIEIYAERTEYLNE